jgi:hypothetical protein
VSIGADATWLTSSHNASSTPQGGLNGHNLIEADASLTRNDYGIGGDAFTCANVIDQALQIAYLDVCL